MALTAAWMSACDMLGVKTQTLGPNVAVTASGQRLAAGDVSALAPPAVAISAAAPKITALTRRRTIRCIKAPPAEFRRGNQMTRNVRGAAHRAGPSGRAQAIERTPDSAKSREIGTPLRSGPSSTASYEEALAGLHHYAGDTGKRRLAAEASHRPRRPNLRR